MQWSPSDLSNATMWDLRDAFKGWQNANGIKGKKESKLTRKDLKGLKEKFPDYEVINGKKVFSEV